MEFYKCDGCGAEMRKGDLRYNVKIEVKAAYDTMEIGLADLIRDHRDELVKLINELEDKKPSDVEKTVYKGFHLHLCPRCQRAYIQDPMRFHPEQIPEGEAFDIDTFLRSLGIRGPEDDHDDS